MHKTVQGRAIAGASKHLELAFISFLAALNSTAIGAWLWLKSNRALLPDPHSAEGEDLLRRYLMISHEIFLAIIICTSGFLIVKAVSSRQKEANRGQRFQFAHIRAFICTHRVYTAIFIAYTVAMLHESSFLYKDLIGWTGNFFSDQISESFTIKSRILGETMRRSDYRFFPLAHQDLHILSWSSHQIKTWLLASAAQLAIITIALTKLVKTLSAGANKRLTDPLLLITLLILFHPSPTESFFQVIYSERMLTFFFCLFALSYANYRKTGYKSSLYLTILYALLGSFTKDIAIVLFCTPPAVILAYEAIQQHNKRIVLNQEADRRSGKQFCKAEKYLLYLAPAFCLFYISLSVIPSTYANQTAYADDYTFTFSPDLRLILFAFYCAARLILIATRRLSPSLLDALNLAAINYSIALFFLIGLQADSYLSLPVQIIIVINIAYLWCHASSTIKTKKNSHFLQLSAPGLAFLILASEAALKQTSFADKAIKIKHEQITNTSTFNKIPEVVRKLRRQGSEINLIYDSSSRFSHRRHLNRLNFDRLIEHNEGQLIIKEGRDINNPYQLQSGDLLISINDKPSWFLQPLKGATSTQLFHIKRHHYHGQIIRIDSLESSVAQSE